MNKLVSIRAATHGDLQDICRLLEEGGLPTAGVTEHLATFFVAGEAGGIVGCVGYEPHGPEALLRSLTVRSGSRGSGLGARLIQHVLQALDGVGTRRVHLRTAAAQGYFEPFGFKEISACSVPEGLRMASTQFRGACPDSAAVMVREVAGG